MTAKPEPTPPPKPETVKAQSLQEWFHSVTLVGAGTYILKWFGTATAMITALWFMAQPTVASYVEGTAAAYLTSNGYLNLDGTRKVFVNEGMVNMAQVGEINKKLELSAQEFKMLKEKVEALNGNDIRNAEILRNLENNSNSQELFNQTLYQFLAQQARQNAGQAPLPLPPAGSMPLAPPINPMLPLGPNAFGQ